MSDNGNMTTAIKHRNTPSRDADAEVGKRAHMLIWSHSLKQGDVANNIGMSSGSLGLKLKGQRGWAIAEIIAIAEALHTTVGYLVGETENPHPDNPDGDNVEPPARLERATCGLQGGTLAPVTPLFGRKAS